MEDKKCCTTVNNYYGCCENGTGSPAEQSWEHYSFDEIAIGTWVDGKTIYRKVFEGQLAVNNGQSLIFANVSTLKIDRMINICGNLISDQGEGSHITIQTSYNTPQGLKAAVNMWYSGPNKEIRYHLLNNDGNYSRSTAYVVLEYTKLDDEAV